MAEEAAAVRDRSDSVGEVRRGTTRAATLTSIRLNGRSGDLLTTGIGAVNASAALTAWAARRGDHASDVPVVSIGSAGGLADEVAVGDVVIGSTCRYADVDARAFGYELGQVPGMPADYPAGLDVVSGVRGAGGFHTGLLVTSSSFIGAEAAALIRERFPQALAVDMESAALAQACLVLGLRRFVSVRGISDLCTPRAGEDFSDGLSLAAARSADAVVALLTP